MRNLTAAALAVLLVGTAGGMSACTQLTAPAAVSDRTVLDEKLATGAEVSYTAASRLGAKLAQFGLIDKAKFKAADNRGYAALNAVRTAYRASNAASYSAALAELNAAVVAIRETVR